MGSPKNLMKGEKDTHISSTPGARSSPNFRRAPFFRLRAVNYGKNKNPQNKEIDMNFKNATYTTAALCFALLFFCSLGLAQDVTWNALPGTNFSGFHTYQWANCGNAHPNGIVDAEIKQDINSVLTQKGFTMVAPETQSDLLVCYQVAVQQQTQWNAYGMGGFRFGGMGTATSST